MSNKVTVEAATQGLSQVLKEMAALAKALKSLQKDANDAAGAQNNQANASNKQSKAAHDATESISSLGRVHGNVARQMSDLAKSSSASIAVAYAEIAATTFSLAAAFELLKSSAQYDNLINAQASFAQATGVNLSSVGKILQEATGHALQFQEAASLATVGKTAGFTSEQMVNIAKRAKAAAVVLGRDVPDALSRAFRGVAKGEPEILDELGVFIRLDKAYKNYAITLGTTSDKLTALQQKQAIYAAFMKSSQIYQPVEEAIKVDPFTQAQAEFQTTIKELGAAFTNSIGPLVQYLSQNSGALMALVLLLSGKTLSSAGKVLFNPAVVREQLTGYRKLAVEDKKVIEAQKKNLQAFGMFATQSAKRQAFGTWFTSIDDTSKAIDRLGIAGTSRLAKLNEEFKQGKIGAKEFMDQLTKPGRNSLNTQIQKMSMQYRDTGSASYGRTPLDKEATQDLLNSLERQKAATKTMSANAITFGNAWKYGEAMLTLAKAKADLLTASVAKLTTYVKLGATVIMSTVLAIANMVGIVFLAVEGIKALSDWFGYGTENADQFMTAVTDANKMIADSYKGLEESRKQALSTLTADTSLRELGAQAGYLATVSERAKELAAKAKEYKPGKFFGDGIGSDDIKSMQTFLDMMESSPEFMKEFNAVAEANGTSISKIRKELNNKVFDNAPENFKLIGQAADNSQASFAKSAEVANDLAEAHRNLATAFAQSESAFNSFITSQVTKSSATESILSLDKLKIELESYAKNLKNVDATVRDSAQKSIIGLYNTYKDVLGVGNIRDLDLGMVAGAKGNSAELASKRLSQLKDGLSEVLGVFTKLDTLEKQNNLSKKQNEEAISSLSNRYREVSPLIAKYLSQSAQVYNISRDIATVNAQIEATQRLPITKDTTKAIADLNIKLGTLNAELANAKGDIFAEQLITIYGGLAKLSDKTVTEGISAVITKLKEADIKIDPSVIASVEKFLNLSAEFDKFKKNTTLAYTEINTAQKTAVDAYRDLFGTVSEVAKLQNLPQNSDTIQAAKDLQDIYQKTFNLLVSANEEEKIRYNLVQKRIELEQKASITLAQGRSDLGFALRGYSQELISAISTFQKDMEDAAVNTAKASVQAKMGAIAKAPGISVTPDMEAYRQAVVKLDTARAKQDKDLTEINTLEALVNAEADNLIKNAEANARANAALSETTIAQIKATYEQARAQKVLIDAYLSTSETINRIIDNLSSGKSISEVGKDIKSELPNLFKGSSSVFKEQIKAQAGKLKELFSNSNSGISGIIGKTVRGFEGIKTVLGDKLPGIGSGIMSILSGNRNGGIGQILGTMFAGPIGGLVGGLIGGAIGKKVLKETGIIARVSAEGVLSAQELNVYKKKGLTGSKTINEIVGNISSEAQMALQDSISKIRDGFVSNMRQLSIYTSGALKYNQNLFSKFTYGGRFTVAAGSDTSGLYDKVRDAYGNALITSLTPIIKAFKVANESLASTLERITHIVKVTDNTFNAVFFKSSGKGISSVLSESYLKQFSEESLTNSIKGFIGDTRRLPFRATNLREVLISPIKALLDDSVKVLSKEDYINAAIEEYKKANAQRDTGLREQEINNYKRQLESAYSVAQEQYNKFLEDNKIFIEYVSNSTAEAAMAIRELGKLDFYNKMFQAFDGATIEEKRKNFDEAMSKYADGVGSSLETLAGNFYQFAIELESTSGLPASVKAASDGIITPIFAFNKQLQQAIEGGASPAEVARAIQTGAKLSDVIQSILQVFSSINISSVTTKADFMTNIISGITDTFKTSLLDQFKKILVAPILGGILNGTGNTGLTAQDISDAGDSLVSRAKELIGLLNNSNTSTALGLVGTEFEKLMKLFGNLDVAASMSNINKVIKDITADLKQSAFDFFTGGDAYSSNLFKATELFKSVGLSGDLSSKPLKEVFESIKGMITSGNIAADAIDSVGSALKAMAEATKAARQQIADTVVATKSLIDDSFVKIKDISMTIAQNGGDLTKAKTIFADLLKYPADQIAKARDVYNKAKASGNLLAIANAGSTLSNLLSEYMTDQISMQEALQRMSEDKYNSEKQAIQDITDWTKELADFAKSLKFDEKLSILAPIDRLTEATKTFDQLKADLLTKTASKTLNADDVKAIQDQSRQLLELGRDVYASGDKYTALYNEVQGLINTTSANLAANQADLQATTQAYQDSSLEYAQQIRDIQLSTLDELKAISERAAYDNAISSQLLDAIKFNQGIPAGLGLTDYYAQLFAAAQSGIGTFTGVGTGFPDFTQGTAAQQQTDASTTPNTPDLNERLVTTLERLEAVLALLPLGIKTAVVSQQTAATRS